MPLALPLIDQPVPGKCCNASEFEIQPDPLPGIRPAARVGTDKWRKLPRSAMEYARRLPPARPVSLPSPFSAAMQNGSPEPARLALARLPFLAAAHPQTAGSLPDTVSSLPAGKLAACAQYGRAAT